MNDTWKRIAGMCVLDDATVGVVWMAIEPDSEVIHVYDACLWKNEPFPVLADGIANRGRWIPLAWSNEPFAEKLQADWGVNVLPDPVDKDPAVAAVQTREIFQRMKARQFRAKKGLKPWIDEWQSFNRESGKVPVDSHPMMTATWYAVANLHYSRAQRAAKGVTTNYPKLAVV